MTLLFTFFQIFQDAARSAAGGTIILYNLTSLSQTPPFFKENAGHFPEKRHDFPDPFSYFPQSSAAFHRSSHLLKNPFHFPPVFSLKTAPILQNTPTAYRNEAKTGRKPAFSHQNAAVAEVFVSKETPFSIAKSVRLAHTRAGARLRQQPYSSPRRVPPCGAFLFNRKRSFLLNKKRPEPRSSQDFQSFSKRRQRDSNPRAGMNRQTHFECAALRPLRYVSWFCTNCYIIHDNFRFV